MKGDNEAAIKAYHGYTGATLEEAGSFVDALQRDDEVAAVKLHASISKASLKESSDFVRAVIGPPHSRPPPRPVRAR
jgi:ribosomal protein L7/L12